MNGRLSKRNGSIKIFNYSGRNALWEALSASKQASAQIFEDIADLWRMRVPYQTIPTTLLRQSILRHMPDSPRRTSFMDKPEGSAIVEYHKGTVTFLIDENYPGTTAGQDYEQQASIGMRVDLKDGTILSCYQNNPAQDEVPKERGYKAVMAFLQRHMEDDSPKVSSYPDYASPFWDEPK